MSFSKVPTTSFLTRKPWIPDQFFAVKPTARLITVLGLSRTNLVSAFMPQVRMKLSSRNSPHLYMFTPGSALPDGPNPRNVSHSRLLIYAIYIFWSLYTACANTTKATTVFSDYYYTKADITLINRKMSCYANDNFHHIIIHHKEGLMSRRLDCFQTQRFLGFKIFHIPGVDWASELEGLHRRYRTIWCRNGQWDYLDMEYERCTIIGMIRRSLIFCIS